MFHGGLAILFLMILRVPSFEVEKIEVPIQVEAPLVPQQLTKVIEKPKVVLKSVNETPKTLGPKREVFGASRKSHTDDSVNEREAVDAKKGNTLTKASDKEILQDSDADSLPDPTEEYLVSEMPTVLEEVRPAYPKEARDQRLEGAVVMDILIDQNGLVRKAQVVEGLTLFVNGALEAIKKFKFKPAEVDGRPVAVNIRYTLRFQLEY